MGQPFMPPPQAFVSYDPFGNIVLRAVVAGGSHIDVPLADQDALKLAETLALAAKHPHPRPWTEDRCLGISEELIFE